MKNLMFFILGFLPLFVVLSSQAEAAVTNGEVQYYYQRSTATSNSSTSETQENNTTSDSHPLSTTSEEVNREGESASLNHRGGTSHSGITRFLQTNDQRNPFLIVVGILILAIAFLGWRIVKNRRKNE